MNPQAVDRWRRAREILPVAIELPPSSREAFVHEQCAGDGELEGYVLRLLALADLDSTQPMVRGAFEGRTVGSYRLLSRLGRGGLGEVWLAQRIDDLHMRVAIKFLLPDRNSEDFRKRFKAETQILALLRHENIVRLLDAGATEDGMPYFVMEYVEGLPVDRYCRENRRTTAEKLTLFTAICDAVQYAHNHLLVHRDLKPGNILVTADGHPKLLDFGIAKLIRPEMLGADELYTLPYTQPFTPVYASPEQLTGGLITTATDIFSLGVILCELLTDQVPFPAEDRSFEQYRALVCSSQPEPPSTLAARTAGGGGNGVKKRAGRELRGELDNIVLKAIRKEPDRRYRSADELADDIRRHLSGLPVRAQPDSLRYRTGKFLSRHKAAAAVSGLLVLSLAAGLLATVQERRVAERQRDLAQSRLAQMEDLGRRFVATFRSVEQSCMGPAAAPWSERASAAAAIQPTNLELQKNLARSYIALAVALGRNGRFDAAIEAAQKAVALEQRLATSGGPAADELGSARDVLDRLTRQRSSGGAGVFGFAGASGLMPDTAETMGYAAAYEELGDLLAATGDAGSARQGYLTSLRLQEGLNKDAVAIARVRAKLNGLRPADAVAPSSTQSRLSR